MFKLDINENYQIEIKDYKYVSVQSNISCEPALYMLFYGLEVLGASRVLHTTDIRTILDTRISNYKTEARRRSLDRFEDLPLPIHGALAKNSIIAIWEVEVMEDIKRERIENNLDIDFWTILNEKP